MQYSQDSWYQNPKWRALRAKILRRDCYMDQELRRFGLAREAEVVHHIFPRKEFPEYEYEPWNLISLSKATHKEMHDSENDDLTEKGRDLLRRTCLRMGIKIPEKYQRMKQKGGKRLRDKYYY